MRKKYNNCIYIIIFLEILFSSFSLSFAYDIVASNVGFTPTSSNWKVVNIQASTDSLYYSVSRKRPVGEIIAFMGTIVPNKYLACDGSIYNISDYPYLAEQIKINFGRYNQFGGDGTTTFAVPDLRGEFLRGSGTNSHVSALGDNIMEGSGYNVGYHQFATSIGRFDGENNTIYFHNSVDYLTPSWYDAEKITNRTGLVTISHHEHNSVVGMGTIRPTNTSVLFAIRYE